ncbi:hypothetical protein UFOVP633_34 [uncultured Caudovirales phage]|jgi:hypothetical protein|uniref:Uncharacterized protein n=1 Tax=uncultured Caudovirales phage TaxID=2100421 RepID=A0A6J5NAT6_9CAUD|nr:hypothetical protein UFOVP633_34 [uncultured Caudovirales phage]
MENKVILITSIIGAIAVFFMPVPRTKKVDMHPDRIQQKAELYLEELKADNQISIEALRNEVDSLQTIKRKIRYIYVIKDTTNEIK